MKREIAVVLAAMLAGVVSAKDAKLPEYASAFAEYRPFEEPALASWPEVNEEVARAAQKGGHGAHAKPKPEGKPPPAPAGKPAPKPAPETDHRGHR